MSKSVPRLPSASSAALPPISSTKQSSIKPLTAHSLSAASLQGSHSSAGVSHLRPTRSPEPSTSSSSSTTTPLTTTTPSTTSSTPLTTTPSTISSSTTTPSTKTPSTTKPPLQTTKTQLSSSVLSSVGALRREQSASSLSQQSDKHDAHPKMNANSNASAERENASEKLVSHPRASSVASSPSVRRSSSPSVASPSLNVPKPINSWRSHANMNLNHAPIPAPKVYEITAHDAVKNAPPLSIFEQTGQITIFATTWNLYGQLPSSNLAGVIPRNKYHIYAIGTQECERSIQKSLVVESKKKWEQVLGGHMGPNYELIQNNTLAAIHLALYAHKSVFPYVKDIRSARVATGIGKVLGNKGGIAVSINIGSTRILFVNSHFAAHQSHVEQRNMDFHRINSLLVPRLSVQGATSDDTGNEDIRNDLAVDSVESSYTPVTSLYDYTFWLGDLNYRINGNRKLVDAALEKNLMEVLKANDQLNIQRQEGNVFAGFHEEPIDFPPTYKFDKESETYDSSPKQRIPAWTDRILYHISSSPQHLKDTFKCLMYHSCKDILLSDHRPVCAVFSVLVNIAQNPSSAPRSSSSLQSTICSIS
eukprot:TRINITY_DN6732_c0_g1_i2.p1 TRINITY_DN6732_c0_g1~~TRINITY_DN6732_c0_g1_i2.p1  ORF type:complete len:590 (+),score=131.69 TRINITY_DN6732_c0_g1_i2:58-1827(+)